MRWGEIWVADPGVAHGYWQRPEVSEETFRAQLKDAPEAGAFLADRRFRLYARWGAVYYGPD